MKILYTLLLAGSLLAGIYDGGDLTMFAMVSIFGIAYAADRLFEKVLSKERRKSGKYKTYKKSIRIQG